MALRKTWGIDLKQVHFQAVEYPWNAEGIEEPEEPMASMIFHDIEGLWVVANYNVRPPRL